MSDLDDPLVREHYNRLVKFAEECGLDANQLQKLITLVINLTNARAAVRKQKQREANEPLRLMNGTGL